MTGFEPAVSALTGQRVSPLHYTPGRWEFTTGAERASRETALGAAFRRRGCAGAGLPKRDFEGVKWPFSNALNHPENF